MKGFFRPHVLIILSFLAFVSIGTAECETGMTITDDSHRYFFQSVWEYIEIENISEDCKNTGVTWQLTSLPLRRENVAQEKNTNVFLRNRFRLSSTLKDRQIGLYSGFIRYSCFFYLNGVLIGSVGGDSPDDFPAELTDTYSYFFFSSNIIRYDDDNVLVIKILKPHGTIKIGSMFVSGLKNLKDSFFSDHFKIRTIHLLAGIICIFIFFPLIYLFSKYPKEKYYLYTFLSGLSYAVYCIMIAYEKPPFDYSLFYDISLVAISMGLSFTVVTIQSYFGFDLKFTWLRGVIILIDFVSASIYFFLPNHALKMTYHTYNYLLIFLPQVIYAIIIVSYYQFFMKKERAEYLFFGMSSLLVAGLFDVICDTISVTPPIWISPIGVIVFCLSLFVQIAKRYVDDIREAEQAAAKLRYAAALEDEKERLDVTLNSIGEAVVCTDMNGLITLFNKASENIIGCQKTECFNRPIGEVITVEREEGAGECANELEKLVLSDDDTGSDFTGPYNLKKSDNSLISVLIKKTRIKDKKEETQGIVWIFIDITEREKLEKIQSRNQTLESLGLLAGGIAHDFNNILMGIMLNINLVKRMAPSEERNIQELLTSAEHAVTRASTLTEQLLTFAKGGIPMKQYLDIRPIIKASATFPASCSNIRLAFDLKDDLWLAEVDAGQISMVIYNLVLNSIQALPNGGDIRITAENAVLSGDTPFLEKGRHVVIKVIDNGIGIKKEHLARIFDPYFTTKQSGTGLGLATVFSIIKKHKGYIEVQSEENKGTTFSVYLRAIG